MRGVTIRTTYLISILAVAVAGWTAVGYGASPALGPDAVSPPETRLDYYGEPSPFLRGMSRISGDGEEPQLMLAQRAIDREIGGSEAKSEDDPAQYTYVEVDGWKSPVVAGGLSFIIPGTGQLYTGHKYGFVMMGIQAVALYSYFHFQNEAQSFQNEAFSYAGNPNIAGSRWSFEKFEAEAGREEADKLREIFRRDPVEFYSRVSTQEEYFGGWQGSGQEQIDNVVGYRTLDEDRKDAARASRLGLFAAVANTIVSTVDAVRAANLNNFQIQQNLNLQMEPKLGRDSGLTATVTHRFF
jgi:hypothetical protein